MILSSQRYVSSELAHFVGRRLEAEEQYSLLLKILKEGWITHDPHKINISGNLSVNSSNPFSSNIMLSPQTVCFCDIPIADIRIHVRKYSPFGLSFNKDHIVRQGGCPVFYIPFQGPVNVSKDVPPEERIRLIQESGVDALDEIISNSEYFDRMVRKYISFTSLYRKNIMDNRNTPGVPKEHMMLMDLEFFLNFHIFSYIKFYDHKCTDEHVENYYMEREWRVVGNVNFSIDDIQTIFMPKAFAKRFRVDFPSYSSQLIFV